MLYLKKTGYLLLPLLLFAACRPDTECRTEETVNCRVIFYCDSLMPSADTMKVVYFDVIDSVTVQGVGNDSVLYDNEKGVTSLSLPLKKDANETRYSLKLNEYTDELVIRHQNRDYFVSLACGCFVYHTIDDAYSTANAVNRVEIINSSVENTEQDNLRLYITF